MMMEHIFIKGINEQAPTLLLLHGTGGNEKDLLPLAEMIDKSANVLGVRGNVVENGMPRYFKRLAEGVFDEADLLYRTKELSDFLDDMSNTYQFDRKQVVAIGYSNGANIAASMIFHDQHAFAGAVLLKPMVPLRNIKLPDLTSLPIFIGAGKNDPLISGKETIELKEMLRKAGAQVEEYWGEAGHQLTREEILKAKDWFEKNF